MTAAAQLRTPVIADAQGIASLSSQLGYEVSTEATATRIAMLLDRDDHHLAVSTVEDEIAGWIHVHAYTSLESGHRAEIAGLVVAARFQRKGIGRMLVGDAIKWSNRRGAEALVVRSNVVRKESHQFYPSIGFEAVKTQAVYRKQLKR